MAREMKDSGIEWIGVIPLTWSIRRVKNLASVYTGNSIKEDLKKFYEDPVNAIPYVATKDVDAILQTINFENGMYVKNSDVSFKRAPAQSTLLCVEGGSAGKKIAFTEQVVCFVNKLCCFHSNVESNKYIYYYLMSPAFVQLFNSHISGLIGGVSVKELSNFEITLPPFEEQERIAKYLDAECARIDSVIEQTRASIEEYKKLKQAVITRAVTKGIRPDRAMKDSGIKWIGEIPAEWKVFRIAHLYEERKESGTEDLPILTVSINSGISDHEATDEEQTRVFVRSEDRTKYKRVYKGDLAYNMMRAWQGAFGAVRVDGMVSPAYIVAKPQDDSVMDSRYMEALLRTPSAIEEMHRYSQGITDFRLRLYWPEFKNIKVCLPSYEEQKEIADYIDKKAAEIEELIEKKDALLGEMDSYKKSLIYEHVTGKKEAPL